MRGGDAYVLATLEANVAEPAAFSANSDIRIDLYRLFLKVWESMRSMVLSTRAPVTGREGRVAKPRSNPMQPRIAFLLSSLEGFDTAEVARILECSPEEATSLIDRAGKEISRQIHSDVLIIEDEPLIAIDIQMLVEELGHRVVAIARTRDEAIAAAKNLDAGPDSR